MYVMSMYSTYCPNFRSDIDMNYKESSLNLQPTQDLMNQAYKVSDVALTKNPHEQETLLSGLMAKWFTCLPNLSSVHKN